MKNPNCEKCIDGNGCKEGCAEHFKADLKEADFEGIIINADGDREWL